MQELSWIAETIRVWLEGGSFADIKATEGFRMLVVLAATLVPSSLIALGIGHTQWHETPLGAWFGARPSADEGWAERARDLDKDGTPDF
ncbi:MAG: hypothetical protein JNM59_03705 [Hyphomonadaceae bacterium]|nr:hypothetical protein [Hyphomonadaceae bacterium]